MMKHPARLIFHPLPQAQEGLSSFLLRLAEGNGVKQGDILKVTYGSEKFLPSLVGLLGVSLEHPDLATIKLRMEKSISKSRSIWNLEASRYCPICLDEHPVWKQHWEAKFVTACNLHKIRLLDTCPVCSVKLGWQRLQLNQCQCGAAIQNGVHIEAEASEEEIELTSWFTSKLYGEGAVQGHIANLNVHQLHHLISFLGVYDTLGKNEKKPRNIKLDELETAISIARKGMAILANWPNGFNSFLDRLVARNRSDDRTGRLNGVFGRFYNNFFNAFWEKPFEPYIEAFGQYLENNWRVSFTARNRELSEMLRSRHPWVSACVLAKSLNTSRATLFSLYEEKQISGHVVRTENGRKMFYVNRQEISSIKNFLQDRVNQAEACKILGITKRRFIEITSHPLLGEPRKSGDSAGPWAISRARLKAIVALGSNWTPTAENEAPALISLAFALRHLYYRPDLSQLLTAVHKGRLGTKGLALGRLGIAAWMFDRIEFNAWIKSQNEYSFWSVTEAAKQLGVKDQVAYRLARNNMLDSKISPVTGHIKIEPEALDRFKAKYIFSREIADRIGSISARGIYKRLADVGILPCSGPKIDGCPKCIYERTEALDSVIQKLHKGGRRSSNKRTASSDWASVME